MYGRIFWVLLSLTLVSCGKESAPNNKFTSAILKGESTFELCEKGLDSFKKSVHPLVRAKCIACHDENPTGPKKAPAHSVEDPAISFQRIIRYVNFNNIRESKFYLKGGNQHCAGYGVDCGVTFDHIEKALTDWWEGGQKDCPKDGKYFTTPIMIPTTLPARNQGFTPLRWDLGQVDPSFKGVIFELEAQKFANAGESAKGAYRFRKPRIATSEQAIEIKDVKILINGNYEATSNAFTTINNTVSPQPIPTRQNALLPHPVLSASNLIAIEERPGIDTLTIAFGELKFAGPKACKNVELFKKNVMPVLTVRKCTECHGGGLEQKPGIKPDAVERLKFGATETEICQQALQRVDWSIYANSPFIKYPLKRANGHPQGLPRLDEISPGWEDWLQTEK